MCLSWSQNTFLAPLRHVGTFILWPGIKPAHPALKEQRLSHWATREVPVTEYVLFPDLSFFQGIYGFISDLDIPQFFRRSPIWSSLISLLPTVWFILEMNFFLYAYDSLFPKEGYRYFYLETRLPGLEYKFC